MVKLMNGRGQLGEKLKSLKQLKTSEKVFIYHTWKVPYLHDPKGKEEEIQYIEYKKFIEFVDNSKTTHPDSKIIFVSTNSQRSSFYTYYKELAESYLLLNHSNSYILKFPLFVGKGVLEMIKSGKLNPYGVMEIITLDKVVEEIKNCISRTGMKRVFIIEGEKVKAETIAEVLKI